MAIQFGAAPVKFGAASVTIDRGDHTEPFRLKRSIPLAEAVTDRSGKVLREVEENDAVGKELYKRVKAEIDLLKPALQRLDEDRLELRFTREPHPDEPTNPEQDVVSLRVIPEGKINDGNFTTVVFKDTGLRPHSASTLFSMLRTLSMGKQS